MAVRIKIEQTSIATPDNQYTVITNVLEAEGISSAIFVINTATDVFSRVAVPYDIMTYPDTKEAAEESGSAYYRIDTITITYTTVQTAIQAATYTRDRVEGLALQYEDVVDKFVGTEEYEYEAP
jgi:hypothetical protein